MSEPLFPPPLEQQTAPQSPAPAPQPPEKPKRIILPYVLLGIFLLTLASGVLFFVSLFVPGPMTEVKTVVIPRGSSVAEIADILDQNDVLVSRLLFRISARLMAKNQLRAGEYAFEPGLCVLDVTARMRDGDVVVRQFTVPEGLTSHEIVALLNNTPALSGDVVSLPEEGSLLPETYNYSYNDNRNEIIARMQKDARAALEQLWQERDQDLPLKTPQEALILASIVEKETGKVAHERPLVASVFINRLRIKMPLQSDPTVIYALTGGTGTLGRSLTRADLLTPSPTNTYANMGLPPTPICNPGRAAIKAVLHPEQTSYLYFVANGSGGHAFAKTLDEHNKNVAKWLSLRTP